MEQFVLISTFSFPFALTLCVLDRLRRRWSWGGRWDAFEDTKTGYEARGASAGRRKINLFLTVKNKLRKKNEEERSGKMQAVEK